jgi:hypothetical protein
MGPGAAAEVFVAAAAAGATVVVALPASAAAASASDGIWIVVPVATCAVSGSPLAAARERVVKLLAAAIDQSDSPASTVCGTDP